MTQEKHQKGWSAEGPFLIRLANAFGIKSPQSVDKMKKSIYESASKQTLEAFIKQENFIEVIYAFSTGTDVVALNSEAPPVDKYKKKVSLF